MKPLVLGISRAISNLEWLSQSHASLRLGDIKREQPQQKDVMSSSFPDPQVRVGNGT